ncbi:MAG: WG repeat-containing protein [Terrisporobacter sp.]|uniref:WG repeat-containing protein n=1 Tax=Terrisporobacter sp. TaxID=1965305 RepID=UPI002FCBCE2B
MKNKALILPILRDGKYGFVDKSHRIAIKPRFNYVSNRFKEGYCVVTYIKKIRSTTKWVFGYIDKSGKTNFFLQLESANDFSEGMSKIRVNGKYGFINKSFIEAIEPKYEGALNFSEDLCGVRINKKWGYIDKKGNMIIEPKFSYINNFYNGRALVESKNKYKYIGATCC